MVSIYNKGLNYKYCLCTKEVLDIFVKAKQLVKKQSSHIITFYHIFMVMFMNNKIFNLFLNSSLIDILFSKFKCTSDLITENHNNQYFYKKYNIIFSIPLLYSIQLLSKKNKNYTRLDLLYVLFQNNHVQTDLKESLNIISKTLTEFLTKTTTPSYSILNTIADPISLNTSSTLIGREVELTSMTEILYRNLKQNIILIGSKGIGRFSTVKQLAYKIKSGQVPSFLQKKELWVLNKTYTLGFNSLDKTSVSLLIEQLTTYVAKHKNIILVYPNIEHLIQSTTDNSEISFLDSILPLLENKLIQCIGISNIDITSKLKNINNNFECLKLEELSKENTLKIIISKAKFFEHYYNIVIPMNIINDIMFFSDKYIKDKVFPYKSIYLLDSVCSKFVIQYKNKEFNWKTSNVIQKTVAQITGLPITFILQGQNNTKNTDINYQLKQKIFGQDIAISQVTTALKRVQAGLKQPNKPIGSWLFCGISGTGKTELAKSLAQILFGTETQLIKIDMSEFLEKHSLSKLIGSPPGYVGYGEGGQLTEQVKKNPYSIVLFDEIEKAHPDINNVMLQILEDGKVTDSKGESIDFSHTLIIYTSNLGCPTDSSFFNSFKEGKDLTSDEYTKLTNQVHTAVKNHFKPEFINRLDSIVVFKPLNLENLVSISGKFINMLSTKLKTNNTKLCLNISKDIRYLLAKIAYHPIQGARPLRRLLERLVEKPISDILMNFKFTSSYVFSLYVHNNIIHYSLQKIVN